MNLRNTPKMEGGSVDCIDERNGGGGGGGKILKPLIIKCFLFFFLKSTKFKKTKKNWFFSLYIN